MNMIGNNKFGTSQILDNKKYVVLKYMLAFKTWDVVAESSAGVLIDDADIIRNYEIRYGKVAPNRLIIVEVPEI